MKKFFQTLFSFNTMLDLKLNDILLPSKYLALIYILNKIEDSKFSFFWTERSNHYFDKQRSQYQDTPIFPKSFSNNKEQHHQKGKQLFRKIRVVCLSCNRNSVQWGV